MILFKNILVDIIMYYLTIAADTSKTKTYYCTNVTVTYN